MQRRLVSSLAVVATAILLTGTGLRAGVVEPERPLQCESGVGEVRLRWEIFFLVPIRGFLIRRDDKKIATLPQAAGEYVDSNPSPGEHEYQLVAVSLDGSLGLVGSCKVTVEPGVGELTCTVKENVVHLEWIQFVRVLFDHFRIERNGVVVGRVEGNVMEYSDEVFGVGTHNYAVIGVLTTSDTAGGLLLDRCGVYVECFGLRTRVGALEVFLDWRHRSLPETAGRFFTINRNGALLAETTDLFYLDAVPVPGTYDYEVFMSLGRDLRAPIQLIGACRITVPPTAPVPPVKELQCIVSIANSDPTYVSLILTWGLGGPYDSIIIFRDGNILIELGGDDRKWLDSGLEPGTYSYSVVAFLGGVSSPAVSCEVTIDPPPRRHLLYFSRSYNPGATAGDVPSGGERITCLADNIVPLDGWSFGVGGDPEFLRVNSVDLDGTVTGDLNGGVGPDFLKLEIVNSTHAADIGVIVAAVISAENTEMLPRGSGHRLLNIDFTAGPRGLPGDFYPVDYTDRFLVPVQYLIGDGTVRPEAGAGFVRLLGPRYLRGDSNGDAVVDISDSKFTLDWLFLGGREPGCLEAADANQDHSVNIADPIYTLEWKFNGSPRPPAPFPVCGYALAPLGCKKLGLCGPIPAQNVED